MTDTTPDSLAAAQPPQSQWRLVWEQYKTHRGALIGMGFFLFVVIAVAIGPSLWPIDAQYIDIRARNQGPSLAHPMGTDQLGRDTFARVLMGGQVSMAVGVTAMLPGFLRTGRWSLLQRSATRVARPTPVARIDDQRDVDKQLHIGRSL